LGSVAGLDNNPIAAFRIVFDGSTSSIGNNRIDNFVVEGDAGSSPVPEPASLLLLGVGLSGVAARLRHRMKRTE
jgi:hypothetical protein